MEDAEQRAAAAEARAAESAARVAELEGEQQRRELSARVGGEQMASRLAAQEAELDALRRRAEQAAALNAMLLAIYRTYYRAPPSPEEVAAFAEVVFVLNTPVSQMPSKTELLQRYEQMREQPTTQQVPIERAHRLAPPPQLRLPVGEHRGGAYHQRKQRARAGDAAGGRAVGLVY